MVEVVINKRSYHFNTEWEDITIQEAINLRVLLDNIPEKLKAVYDCYVTKETKKNKEELGKKLEAALMEITKEEEIREFPEFYGEVIMMLSDIPKSVIKRVLWRERVRIYDRMCLQIVISLLWEPKHIKPVKSIQLGKEILFGPEDKKILDEVRPMGHSQSVTFTESTDLELFSEEMKGGKYSVWPNIISIVYRPEGEEYDEDKSLKRAEKLKELDMKTAWGVFFYLKEHVNSLTKNIQILEALHKVAQLESQLSQAGSTSSDG